ncbi:MAG: YIP1 family protein [Clostridia bacterium]|nr:YIP1 family protein [Clostridia bacterium]
MRKLSCILAIVLVLCSLFVLVPSAEEAYDTYTYSIDGEKLLSPDAYSAKDTNKPITSKEMGLDTPLGKATDIITDQDGNVYIADPENNRFVILDKNYRVRQVVSTYTDENGAVQSFSAPRGLSITDSNYTPDHRSQVYVCDANTKKIVCFERESLLAVTDGAYRAEKTVLEPVSELMINPYKPIALAVDKYGRIFVVSEGEFQGIIVMSNDGEFTGFIGAQKVTKSLLDQIWGKLLSVEKKQDEARNTGTAYCNIIVDTDGFIFVTNDSLQATEQFAAITSKEATHSPVKRLNSSGDEIMARNGFFDCGGEVDVLEDSVSKIRDVAVGPEGTWSILDDRSESDGMARSRIFTYNANGDLLFAFGDRGEQIGSGKDYTGFTYQHIVRTDKNGNEKDVYNILTLDTQNAKSQITVFSPTPYYEQIIRAHALQNSHEYEAAIDVWQEILKLNNNFDLAYIGIGKALYSQQKYKESMDMLAAAYETEQYAKAFGEVRSDIIGRFLPLVIIGIIALVVLLLKFLGYAKKLNKKTALKVGRKSYWEELIYSFHLIFHPFDGFWDLRHERRGSVRAATTILGITILAFFYQAIGQGYIFNPRGDYSTVILQVTAVLVPVLLWCIANWCLTTLFDGEGRFRDIYIATCYSLAPLPFFVILSTVLSNIFSDGSIINLLISFGYVWVALLLFFGMLVTHNYTMPKNILMILCTIVAMVVIMFVAILFSTLLIKVASFVIAILTEVFKRLA